VSLVIILAMESVTVFATEVGGSLSPDSRNVLYGNAGDENTAQQQGYTTEQVNEAIKKTEGIKTTPVEEIIKNTNTKPEFDENNERVTNITSGKIFEKNEGKVYEYNSPGTSSTTNRGDGRISSSVIQNDDKYPPQDMTRDAIEKSIAVIEASEEAGNAVGAQLEGSRFADVDPTVGASRENIKVTYPGVTTNDSNKVGAFHIDDNGRVETLEANVVTDGVIDVKPPNSFSPIIVVKFDKPVPGLTYEIEYTSSSVDLSTITGATSPKTAEAEPFKTLAVLAMIALAGVAICTRKITNK
jgi:hypothetical protein